MAGVPVINLEADVAAASTNQHLLQKHLASAGASFSSTMKGMNMPPCDGATSGVVGNKVAVPSIASKPNNLTGFEFQFSDNVKKFMTTNHKKDNAAHFGLWAFQKLISYVVSWFMYLLFLHVHKRKCSRQLWLCLWRVWRDH